VRLFATLMEQSVHLRMVRLQNNPGLTSVNIERVIEAANSHCNLKRLMFTDGARIPLSHQIVACFVRLRQEKPGIIIGSGRFGRIIEGLIASNSIENLIAKAEVQKRQANILRKFVDGDTSTATAGLQELQELVAGPEQARILALLPKLVQRYELIGGLEFLATLPENFDRYKGENPLTQFVASAQLDEGQSTRVRSLLAIAAYKHTVLLDLCSFVKEAFEALATSKAFLVPALVDAYLREYQLDGVFAELRAFMLTFPEDADDEFQRVCGHYVQIGFYEGKPCFERLEEKGSSSFLFCKNLVEGHFEWIISPDAVGADSGAVRLGDDIELADGLEWTYGFATGRSKFVGTLKPMTHQARLRDGLVSFLQKRVNDPDIQQMMSLGTDLTRLSMGPPKSFTRAIDKGSPEQLKDLNRCTFEFDAPIMMVLGFHLLRVKVAELGGSITRLSNLFLSSTDFVKNGGRFNIAYKQPPVLHLFVEINGWTFEVMLALVDVIKAKEMLHKFYDIVRADSVEEALMPVFATQNDFSTQAVAGSAMNVAGARRS